MIALLTVLLLPFVEQANEEVELTYGVEITETTGSLINKSIIFTDDDGNRLKCPMPSKSELKNKAPMDCKDGNGVVHMIEALKPVQTGRAPRTWCYPRRSSPGTLLVVGLRCGGPLSEGVIQLASVRR